MRSFSLMLEFAPTTISHLPVPSGPTINNFLEGVTANGGITDDLKRVFPSSLIEASATDQIVVSARGLQLATRHSILTVYGWSIAKSALGLEVLGSLLEISAFCQVLGERRGFPVEVGGIPTVAVEFQ